MAGKSYRVIWGRWRPTLSIGSKTLIAFLLIIFILAGGFYYFATSILSSQIEKEALSGLSSKLKGALRLYSSRPDQMRLGMLQAGSEESVKEAVERKDSKFLSRLLSGYSSSRPYVDMWVVVDHSGRVIATRSGRADSGVFDINGVVSKALATGEPAVSTEAVAREALGVDGASLASKADPSGIMQLSVVPVRSKEKVKGAFITGILLNKNDWLPDAVYENFQTASAVFGFNSQEPKAIASSNVARSVFSPLTVLPEPAAKAVMEKRRFIGSAVFDGADAYIGVEPIMDSSGRVIGGVAVGVYGTDVRRNIVSMRNNILIVTSFGVILSLVLAGLAYRDTTKPINAIIGAMDETAGGNLDIRVEIKTKDDFERIGEGLNHMVGSIQVREERLDRFNELSKILIESKEPDVLLKRALARMIELTGSHMGIVYLNDENERMLRPAASHGVGEGELKPLKVGEGLAGKSAAERKTIVLQDITEDNVPLEAGFARIVPTGLAWFAMCYKDRLIGVFLIGSLKPYLKEEIRHIEHLVTQIAIALDNAIAHNEIERLSVTDPLTGLFNRRHFVQLFDKEFSGAQRYNYCMAILMIDIDDFKSINDTYGHQTGDKVLSQVARLLREKTRSTDVWARYGGEEFIGYISHAGPEGAAALAEKIRKNTEGVAFAGLNGRRVTVSIGIGYYPAEGASNIEDIIKVADERLYKAKRSGKNRVVS